MPKILSFLEIFHYLINILLIASDFIHSYPYFWISEEFDKYTDKSYNFELCADKYFKNFPRFGGLDTGPAISFFHPHFILIRLQINHHLDKFCYKSSKKLKITNNFQRRWLSNLKHPVYYWNVYFLLLFFWLHDFQGNACSRI